MSGPEVGRTKAAGFQAGARATLNVPARRLWEFIVSAEGQYALGSASSELTKDSEGVTAFIDGSHFRRRISADDGRGWLLQVRVLEAPVGRSRIALHGERLADAGDREETLKRFHEILRSIGLAVSAAASAPT